MNKKARKAIGIVRKTDTLGRIVLPKELRRTYKIDEGTPLEIYTEEDCIILKKYEPACIFCGTANDVTDYMGKLVCEKCKKAICPA